METVNDVQVTLIKHDLSDAAVCQMARVSTGTRNIDADKGLINALVRDRHGVPFEHVAATFEFHVPLFVQQQVLKHRAGVSISQESGRYREFEPVFYVPDAGSRPMGQTGKAMDYNLQSLGETMQHHCVEDIEVASAQSLLWYQHLLEQGAAKEVARMVLPANLMTKAMVTMNARAIMHFLSLRMNVEGQTYVSHPQYEIELLAEKIEAIFDRFMPLTCAAFYQHGRVAP